MRSVIEMVLIYCCVTCVLCGLVVPTACRQASRATWSMPQLYLLPILTTAALLLFFAYWLIVYIYLATCSTPTGGDFCAPSNAFQSAAEDAATGHVVYEDSQEYQKLWFA